MKGTISREVQLSRINIIIKRNFLKILFFEGNLIHNEKLFLKDLPTPHSFQFWWCLLRYSQTQEIFPKLYPLYQ